MSEEPETESGSVNSDRTNLKESVTFILLTLLPGIGMCLIFPLDHLLGMQGQAVGVGLLIGSLIAGSLLNLCAGRGRTTRILLSLLAYALYIGFFYLVRASSFFAESAMGTITFTAMPFVVLATARTLTRAFHPADFISPAEAEPVDKDAEGL